MPIPKNRTRVFAILRMLMSYQLFCFIFAILTLVNAHPQQTTYNEDDCTVSTFQRKVLKGFFECEPGAKAFESYHIHVLFYPDLPSAEFGNNTHASKFARILRHKFVEYFDVSDCAEATKGLFSKMSTKVFFTPKMYLRLNFLQKDKIWTDLFGQL